jgi:hypothetical protein
VSIKKYICDEKHRDIIVALGYKPERFADALLL